MSEWLSKCCGEPPDTRFSFDDYMTNTPIGNCNKCKDRTSFHKENKNGND